ncbi:MAG TPA: FtsW/RodA/SpoVE family cell cycle protein [Bacteroidales bacterium]|nr:FtsW/RodA/SpoVE family cell cycle protein [Bacteroidales bacterium]HOX76657.1 FtsW/RodA/SpoVE family cell cycle protein [Bacteroidales bacterium]
MTGENKHMKGDRVIWMVVILLSLLSLLAVYSSTGTLAYKYQEGNTIYYMVKHMIILALGFGLMYLAHKVKYTYYSRIFQVALYVAILLLIVTLIFGKDVNEAKRALQLPFGLTFQAADLAKLTLIIYLARELTKKQEVIHEFKSLFIPVMLPILVVCGLILPGNLSTAVMLFVTSLVLLFIGRIRILNLMKLVGIAAAAFLLFIGILMLLPQGSQGRLKTWENRMESFLAGADQEEDDQVVQSKIAVVSGGIFGKMPGNSTQRNFLSHPYSDFIFAIILEEYGLLGGSFVVLLYMILLFRAVRIVTKTPRTFGAFLTIGVAFSLVFQALINMGVAVDLLPVTGQPLPLVSMGGTSIWFTSLSIGIILSVSKEVGKGTVENEPKEPEEQYVTA